MANATEVARAKKNLIDGRAGTVAEERTLLTADAGTVYQGKTAPLAIRQDLVAASVDKWMFVADKPYRVVGFEEIHSVVGGSAAAVRPRKVTAAATDAPGAAASATVKELTTAAIDLTAAINVVQVPTLTATDADRFLATGDKIGLDFSGTLTGLVGELWVYLLPV